MKYIKSSLLPHFSYCVIKSLLCKAKQMLQKSNQKIFLQILSRAICQEQTASQLEQPKRVCWTSLHGPFKDQVNC